MVESAKTGGERSEEMHFIIMEDSRSLVHEPHGLGELRSAKTKGKRRVTKRILKLLVFLSILTLTISTLTTSMVNAQALVWTQTENPSSGSDDATGVAVDGTGVYVVGNDNSPGPNDFQWRVQKRSLTDGSLMWTQTENPSSGYDGASGVILDGTGIYVVGSDYVPGNSRWRIEKRALGELAVTVVSPKTSITIDGISYVSGQAFKWKIGSTHTLQVDATVQGGSGVRYVFVQWSDGSKDASRSLTVSEPITYTATFKTQYYLRVSSPHGTVAGEGWYDESSVATFSVVFQESQEGFFGFLEGKRSFQSWSGDSTAQSATATLKMDGPKIVQARWTTDYSQSYMILGIVAVVILLAVLLMRRKKAAAQSYAPAPPPPPQTQSQSPLCVNCGRPTKYIEQYQRYYCFECKKYA